MSLIIVESPTKARTFNRLLKGKDYFVFATMGHFRDLPKNKIAIDYTKDFQPDYVIAKNKEKVVDQLHKLASENTEIILATDPDREGESIAYHVAYILGLVKESWPDFIMDNEKVKRIVFHEITFSALKEALDNPTTLRIDLVKAQQARRILDRIVGYELSPLLWKKMGKNWLSAGRVQTAALRLIVEREHEIKKFMLEKYCQIYARFMIDSISLRAKLTAKNAVPYEIKTKIALFVGDYTYVKTSISKEQAVLVQNDLGSDSFAISDIKEDMQNRYPPPPLTTSLLQQEAFQRYGFSSKMTMKLAQDLYEQGLITYHRTDSFNLSTQFVFRAKEYILKRFGENYVLDKPRGYRTKSRMAQEAHEAIRPTKLENEPKRVHKSKKRKKSFTQYHQRLYELVFNRAVSTQMKEAQLKHTALTIISRKGYEFQTEHQQIIFDGFLSLLNPEYVKNNLASLAVNRSAKPNYQSSEIEELDTKSPPRYNEATLIKILEEKGIGRPSTYAPILSLIQEKNYVEKDYRYFLPTKLGDAIAVYLAKAFSQVFDLDFTAQMEEGLDKVADGNENFIALLKQFYQPFHDELEVRKSDNETIDVEEDINETCPKCGSNMVIRYSRFGKFMACSNYPTCKYTKSFLKIVKNRKCTECGGDVIIRFTKSKKRFYGCSNYPKCTWSSWKLEHNGT